MCRLIDEYEFSNDNGIAGAYITLINSDHVYEWNGENFSKHKYCSINIIPNKT